MALTVGRLEWRIQAVGTGVLGDAAPVDLGIVTADVGPGNAITVSGSDFTERLTLAMAAFSAVLNAEL